MTALWRADIAIDVSSIEECLRAMSRERRIRAEKAIAGAAELCADQHYASCSNVAWCSSIELYGFTIHFCLTSFIFFALKIYEAPKPGRDACIAPGFFVFKSNDRIQKLFDFSGLPRQFFIDLSPYESFDVARLNDRACLFDWITVSLPHGGVGTTRPNDRAGLVDWITVSSPHEGFDAAWLNDHNYLASKETSMLPHIYPRGFAH